MAVCNARIIYQSLHALFILDNIKANIKHIVYAMKSSDVLVKCIIMGINSQ